MKRTLGAATVVLLLFALVSCATSGSSPATNAARVIVHGKYVITGESTAEGKLEILRDAAVFEENGAIKEVGPFADLCRRYPDAAILGGERFVVTPGFTNAHHHTSGITFFQTGHVDMVLEEWLSQMQNAASSDRYYNELAS
ncbi:MAG: hypothetical protein A2Z34_06895 [Planctomycetes bacterium RBG_16_59_8]|nr:MAG: hypothetical protein A2Z34_06895 [Planctomycetes bacterium RBG_16_59_8]